MFSVLIKNMFRTWFYFWVNLKFSKIVSVEFLYLSYPLHFAGMLNSSSRDSALDSPNVCSSSRKRNNCQTAAWSRGSCWGWGQTEWRTLHYHTSTGITVDKTFIVINIPGFIFKLVLVKHTYFFEKESTICHLLWIPEIQF